jgi:3-mercaptopropionate dioxygenase
MACLSLDDYVAAVTKLVGSGCSVEDLVKEIAPLKAELLKTADLIPERFHEGLEHVPYTRNLLHADPEGRFTVMALAWGAGRQSPIHDHETWGVVGVYASGIDVVDYHPPEEGAALVEKEQLRAEAGEVISIYPPRSHNIHRMSNVRNRETTLTIHTYGDPATLCRVYDPEGGEHCDRPLRFHHAL